MNYIVSTAQLAALYILVRNGLLLRFPFFAAFLLIGSIATAIFPPLDPAWLENWWAVGAAALLFRAAATAEAVLILCSRSRGSVGFIAGAWVAFAAAGVYCGSILWDGNAAVNYFHIRDAVQIGLAVAMLAPLCIAYLLPDAFPCRQIERRHAACMLVILTAYAWWSLVRTAGYLHVSELGVWDAIVSAGVSIAFILWATVIGRTPALTA